MRDVSAAVYVAALAVQEGLSRKKASFGYCLDEDEHPRISRTDQQFEEKGLEFVWGMDELSIDELNDLFVRVSRSACIEAAMPSVASRCQHHVRSSARLQGGDGSRHACGVQKALLPWLPGGPGV